MACKIYCTLRSAVDAFMSTKLMQALKTGYPSINTDNKNQNLIFLFIGGTMEDLVYV